MNFDHLFQVVVREMDDVFEKHRYDLHNFEIVGIGADGTETAQLDKLLENTIIDSLQRSRVGGSVLSEEAGWIPLEGEDSSYIFVIDPLDGTSNAKMGFPYYALSVAVVKEGQTIFGLVYNYASKECYSASRMGGAYCNGRPIRVDGETSADASRLVLSRPFNWKEAEWYTKCIMNTKRIRMTGCPSLDVVSVAAGTFNGYIDYHVPSGLIKTHDILASQLIIEEAGGLLLDEQGARLCLKLDVVSVYNVFAVNKRETFEAAAECFELYAKEGHR